MPNTRRGSRSKVSAKAETGQLNDILSNYLAGLVGCIEEIARQDVAGVAEVIYRAYLEKKHIYIFGNGGSSATASHMVCDFQKGTSVPGKPRLRVSCLSDNTPLMTAIGNDIDFRDVFVEQLVSQLSPGDVAIGISCSGNSPNVLKAIAYAKECGAITIGFTAFGGGELRRMADKSINLTSRDYGQAEDVHLCLDHILTCMLKARIENG
jgi:D-sedoheptulose 7-phosphate isomerase